MKKNILLCWYLCFTVLLFPNAAAKVYRLSTGIITLKSTGESLIGLRSFYVNREMHYLAVNPLSLNTSVFKGNDVNFTEVTFADLSVRYKNTPYIKLLDFYYNALTTQTPAGITSLPNRDERSFLTVDLCPSGRPFEKAFFRELFDINDRGLPVTIGVAVSGIWIEHHPEEFQYLRKANESGLLSIIWINHTYTHPYYKNKNAYHDFMLADHINPYYEILENERCMINHGIVPSVFFRYPGLIANKETDTVLEKCGLIPLSADAWLAKGQTPRPGSIILVHGNGNEPKGIKIIISMFRNGYIPGNLSQALLQYLSK